MTNYDEEGLSPASSNSQSIRQSSAAQPEPAAGAGRAERPGTSRKPDRQPAQRSGRYHVAPPAEVCAANNSLAQMQAPGRTASRVAPSAAEASALAAAVEATKPVLATVRNEFLAVLSPSQRAQFQQTP